MATLRLSPVTVSPTKAATPSSVSIRRRSPAVLKFSSSTRGRGGAMSAKMSMAAGSYANALADVAQSTSTLDATMADVEKVEKVFCDPAVISFFGNPTISYEKKREVVDELVKSSELQAHTANFLNVVLDQERFDLLPDIVQEFEKYYNNLTNTEVAVVSSVVRLESQDLAQIAQAVQRLTGAKNVRLKTVLDPSLVAGFTIRYGEGGSKLLDMSVKKQLEEIAQNVELPDVSFPSLS